MLAVVNPDCFACYPVNLVPKLSFKLKIETIKKLERYAIYLVGFVENGVLNQIHME